MRLQGAGILLRIQCRSAELARDRYDPLCRNLAFRHNMTSAPETAQLQRGGPLSGDAPGSTPTTPDGRKPTPSSPTFQPPSIWARLDGIAQFC
jgi:hypothetical protein